MPNDILLGRPYKSTIWIKQNGVLTKQERYREICLPIEIVKSGDLDLNTIEFAWSEPDYQVFKAKTMSGNEVMVKIKESSNATEQPSTEGSVLNLLAVASAPVGGILDGLLSKVMDDKKPVILENTQHESRGESAAYNRMQKQLKTGFPNTPQVLSSWVQPLFNVTDPHLGEKREVVITQKYDKPLGVYISELNDIINGKGTLTQINQAKQELLLLNYSLINTFETLLSDGKIIPISSTLYDFKVKNVEGKMIVEPIIGQGMGYIDTIGENTILRYKKNFKLNNNDAFISLIKRSFCCLTSLTKDILSVGQFPTDRFNNLTKQSTDILQPEVTIVDGHCSLKATVGFEELKQSLLEPELESLSLRMTDVQQNFQRTKMKNIMPLTIQYSPISHHKYIVSSDHLETTLEQQALMFLTEMRTYPNSEINHDFDVDETGKKLLIGGDRDNKLISLTKKIISGEFKVVSVNNGELKCKTKDGLDIKVSDSLFGVLHFDVISSQGKVLSSKRYCDDWTFFGRRVSTEKKESILEKKIDEYIDLLMKQDPDYIYMRKFIIEPQEHFLERYRKANEKRSAIIDKHKQDIIEARISIGATIFHMELEKLKHGDESQQLERQQKLEEFSSLTIEEQNKKLSALVTENKKSRELIAKCSIKKLSPTHKEQQAINEVLTHEATDLNFTRMIDINVDFNKKFSRFIYSGYSDKLCRVLNECKQKEQGLPLRHEYEWNKTSRRLHLNYGT